MKLFITWTQKLSIGIALAVFSCTAQAQSDGYPAPIPLESGSYPTDGYYPQGGMACEPGCEGACDGYGMGFGGGPCHCGSCGGGILESAFGQGCPPGQASGAYGGEGAYGEHRSIGAFCKSLCNRFCGFGCALILPYGEGGVATPRWFDVSAEAIVLKQENGAGNRRISSQGIAPINPDDYVLSTDQVAFDDYQVGMALQANIQVGAGSNLEVVYFGLNEWQESATVVSQTPTLYSFFSDFGTNPFDGFDDSDRSFEHSITYQSELHNGEVNLRRRWAEPCGFFQGSYLAGIRYFQLDEDFVFNARGENNNAAANNGPRFFNYDTETRNQLTGFQLGTDLWLNVIPGVKVGSEVKGGIFGNHAVQRTVIVANSLPAFGIPSIEERASDGRTAYLVQWATQAVFRLTYSIALRGSYQLIWVDNVALAAENLNDEPPALFLPNSNRVVRVENDGEIFYTGFTGGIEYTW